MVVLSAHLPPREPRLLPAAVDRRSAVRSVIVQFAGSSVPGIRLHGSMLSGLRRYLRCEEHQPRFAAQKLTGDLLIEAFLLLTVTDRQVAALPADSID